MGKTQLGGVRGDWFKDLYHREEAGVEAEAEAEFILCIRYIII
jgi:hypothetical protein